MKKIYLLGFLLGAFTFSATAQVELTDDFESYNLGDISSQASHWRTWSGTEGGDEDADVVDSFVNSGDQSLRITDNEITDQILLVPSTPTTGIYTIQWQMYIPFGKAGYFNMQAALTAEGSPWNQALMGGNVYFNCDGSSGGTGGVTGQIDCSSFDETFSYPEDEWFSVTCIYDLDAQTWSMNINGEEQFADYPLEFGTTTFSELAGLNFFSASNSIDMYMDDFVLASGELSVNEFSADVFSVYPNPVKDKLTIESKSAVNSVAIYDVLGKQVLAVQPDAVSPQIDMSRLPSGAYLVKVTIGDSSKTVKVLK